MTTPTTRSLKIPDEHKIALVNLARMPATQFTAMIQTLQEIEPTTSRSKVARQVSKQTGLPIKDASSVLAIIASLYISRERLGLSKAEDLSLAVVGTVTQDQIGDVKSGSNEAAELESRLNQLLSLEDALGPLARARDLLYTYPTLLRFSRILTDIRPVFSSAGEPQTLASVIAHTLVLETWEGGTNREHHLFVSLDSSDLRRLQQIVQRAIAKDDALRRQLEGTKLAPLTVE
jgi:hypothetical protein